jgi:hypothetical protein
MTEQQFINRVQSCERLADLEKAIYDRSAGRASRADCKALVSKMSHLNRAERTTESRNFIFKLLECKKQFFEVIAR